MLSLLVSFLLRASFLLLLPVAFLLPLLRLVSFLLRASSPLLQVAYLLLLPASFHLLFLRWLQPLPNPPLLKPNLNLLKPNLNLLNLKLNLSLALMRAEAAGTWRPIRSPNHQPEHLSSFRQAGASPGHQTPALVVCYACSIALAWMLAADPSTCLPLSDQNLHQKLNQNSNPALPVRY